MSHYMTHCSRSKCKHGRLVVRRRKCCGCFFSVINEKEKASSTKHLGAMLGNEKVISKIVRGECSWFDPYAINSMVLWPCTYANCRPDYCAFFSLQLMNKQCNKQTVTKCTFSAFCHQFHPMYILQQQ